MIDLDPQGNASTALGVPHTADIPSIYDVLIDDFPLADIIQTSPESTEPALRAEHDPPRRRRDRARVAGRARAPAAHRARRVPRNLEERLDFVLIDCPPSLGLLTINAFTAAQRAAHPDPVRVLRARGPQPAARHGPHDPEAPQPAAAPVDDPADDVRRAHAPRAAGRRRGAPALPRRGARHRHPALRARVRGAELRTDGHRLRWAVGRRHRVPRGSRRDHPPRHADAAATITGMPAPEKKGIPDGQTNRPGTGDRRLIPTSEPHRGASGRRVLPRCVPPDEQLEGAHRGARARASRTSTRTRSSRTRGSRARTSTRTTSPSSSTACASSACCSPSSSATRATARTSSSWASGARAPPARRASLDPRGHPRHRRRAPAARRPAREPPPLRAEPARRGLGLPAAARGLRHHPGGARQPHRSLPPADQQHHPAPEAAAAGSAARRRRRADRRPRAGDPLARRPRGDAAPRRQDRQRGPLGARRRGGREGAGCRAPAAFEAPGRRAPRAPRRGRRAPRRPAEHARQDLARRKKRPDQHRFRQHPGSEPHPR